jgi:predicted O-methyltransferase YrrM
MPPEPDGVCTIKPPDQYGGVTTLTIETWTAVDNYISDMIAHSDEALDAALAHSREAGLPPINVSPAQGKMLHILALGLGARRILEVGTLGGYSAIWMARALPPDGRLITLEIDPKHADVARGNLERAGLTNRVEVRLGRAIETLPKIAAEHTGPFDLVFIDADKPSNADYFEWAIRLSRPGTVIVVDNVVRDGGVTDAKGDDNVQGVRRLFEALKGDQRVSATAVQTVGIKGYDGFVLAVVR